ncbi:MAG: methyl-accepting chemotaxis protein [Betaproteobacteria bacterium]|nr:methyl-accepting chemotaxis protein [Betaproteobacteria bacterium]
MFFPWLNQGSTAFFGSRFNGFSRTASSKCSGYALSEQSASAKDIANKIELIAQGSDQSAQSIRNVASASLRMNELSELLKSMSSRFRIAH